MRYGSFCGRLMRPFRLLGVLVVFALGLTACGGDDLGNGTMRLALTDAPACGYDQVNVTVEKVRLHKASGAGVSDIGWSEIVLNPARRIDLLGLTNGVLEELGEIALEEGTYRQMRLVLASNSGSNPMANSVVPTGSAEVALTTPSAQQSGLKMTVNLGVAEGQRADFVLDFDACKSVVRRGNSGQYNLKPVISVIPRLISGIEGYVDSAMTGAVVSVQQDGVIVRATPPRADGSFLLQPLLPGSYDLVVTAPGHVSAVVSGVPVSSEQVTALNPSSSPLNPPTSTMRAVSGVVTRTGQPVTADLLAKQTFTGGPTVEIASAVADETLGTYEFSLPGSPPQKECFVPCAPVVDPAVDGKYAVTATQAGDSLSHDADISTADASVNFDFP